MAFSLESLRALRSSRNELIGHLVENWLEDVRFMAMAGKHEANIQFDFDHTKTVIHITGKHRNQLLPFSGSFLQETFTGCKITEMITSTTREIEAIATRFKIRSLHSRLIGQNEHVHWQQCIHTEFHR